MFTESSTQPENPNSGGHLNRPENDDRRSPDRCVAARKRKAARRAVHAKTRDCVGALVTAIQVLSRWIDSEAARIVTAGPRFACKTQLARSADCKYGNAVVKPVSGIEKLSVT